MRRTVAGLAPSAERDPDLRRAQAHDVRQHAVDAHRSEEERDQRGDQEHGHREARAAHRIAEHALHRLNLRHRQIGVQLRDRAADRAHQAERLDGGTNGHRHRSHAAAGGVEHRQVQELLRRHIETGIVHVPHDADDCAQIASRCRSVCPAHSSEASTWALTELLMMTEDETTIVVVRRERAVPRRRGCSSLRSTRASCGEPRRRAEARPRPEGTPRSPPQSCCHPVRGSALMAPARVTPGTASSRSMSRS